MLYLTDTVFDFIVVGSGPTGAMCSQTLVESGKQVLMLDAGFENREEKTGMMEDNFDQIRARNPSQETLFLGKKFEALTWGPSAAASQLTPSRKFITEKVKELLPVFSTGFSPVESLAYGGLGEGWGLGACVFSPRELEKIGIDDPIMRNAYQVIADRIGISYSPDDIEPYTMEGLQRLQPAIEIDDPAKKIMRRYLTCRNSLLKDQFYLGIPSLALLTQNKENRLATDYSNMDFYTNSGLSAYRPSITVDNLKRRPNFVYCGGLLVTDFKEEMGLVRVRGTLLNSNETIQFSAKKLLIATNVLNTGRIVLRSLEKWDEKLPLLCNPFSYKTCIQWDMLGKVPSSKRTSTVQLSLFHDMQNKNENVAMASLYTYSSLMLFRAIAEVPLNFIDARIILQYLLPATLIASIYHPDETSDKKFIRLIRKPGFRTGDALEAQYEQHRQESDSIKERNKLFAGALRKLGCWPIRNTNPGAGASIHYAGILPYCKEEKPFTIQPNGRLSQCNHVFIADGSGFKYLPAKGITFTLMANAHRVAVHALTYD